MGPMLFLLAAALAPPVPAPPADRLEAALALWADHPPSADARQRAITAAVYSATGRALNEVEVHAGGDIATTGRYLKKFDRLRPLIARHLPADLAQVEREVATCVVDWVARALTPAEIASVRTFMATPAGRRFWNNSALGGANYEQCYGQALVFILKASAEDYRAVGLKPPKPKYRDVNIVN